jgi:hypothetical protein
MSSWGVKSVGQRLGVDKLGRIGPDPEVNLSMPANRCVIWITLIGCPVTRTPLCIGH